MKKKSIIKVVALKYDGLLFETAKEVEDYIVCENEKLKFEKELKKQKKLRDPFNFEITSGYFDFLIYKNGYQDRDENIKYVCYKTKRFQDALEKVIKRKDVSAYGSLDYECYILDKNKKRTNYTIDLHDIPENHTARNYF
ncbi:MAG: hypothetical protein AABY22_18825 [Nanoarchaeota archaeon]